MQPARKLGGILGAAAITMVAIVIAACSDSSQSPMSPSAQRDLNAQISARSSAGGGCLSSTTVVKDINALFPSGGPNYLNGKVSLYSAELVAAAKPDLASAQQIAFQLVDTTLKLFQAGKLIGGQSAATTQLTVTVLNAVLCSAGLPQTLTAALLGTGATGAAQVVQVNAPTTTVATGDQNAGVQIPQGNLKHTTLVTITPITGPPCAPYSGVLCTPLAQFPPNYQYTFTPSVDSTQTPNPFTYEVCATTTNINVPVSQLFLAHNVTNPANGITTAQVLPNRPATSTSSAIRRSACTRRRAPACSSWPAAVMCVGRWNRLRRPPRDSSSPTPSPPGPRPALLARRTRRVRSGSWT